MPKDKVIDERICDTVSRVIDKKCPYKDHCPKSCYMYDAIEKLLTDHDTLAEVKRYCEYRPTCVWCELRRNRCPQDIRPQEWDIPEILKIVRGEL